MKEQLTIYRVQGKLIGLVFLFKYDLNGFIRAWEVSVGEINESQSRWLFTVPEGQLAARFPANEEDFKARWLNNKDILDKFEISISPADISFEAFYEAYGYKVKPEITRKAWDKLKEADRIKAFNALPRYEAHLIQTGHGKAYPASWINGKRWLDEYPEAPPVYKKEPIGKNYNPAIANLAKNKTEK